MIGFVIQCLLVRSFHLYLVIDDTDSVALEGTPRTRNTLFQMLNVNYLIWLGER